MSAERLGACWGYGSHSFWPWRWSAKRNQYERASRRCRCVETATAAEMEGVH